VQGIATSIDALSVGLQIAGYLWWEALLSAAIIAVVTLVLCFVGVLIGRKFGTKLAEKATILGGVILIAIGIKIFLDGILA
jgi:putative Mn2+ efflux pump MntP